MLLINNKNCISNRIGRKLSKSIMLLTIKTNDIENKTTKTYWMWISN